MVLFVPLQQEALGRELDTAIPSAEAGFSSLSFFWNAAGTYLGLLLSSAFASSNNNKNMFFLPGQPAEETRDALAVLRACQEPPAKEAPQSPTPQAFVRPLRWEWQNIECPRQDERMFFSMFSNGLPVFPPAAELIEFSQEAKPPDRDPEANLSPKAGYRRDPNMTFKWFCPLYI